MEQTMRAGSKQAQVAGWAEGVGKDLYHPVEESEWSSMIM